MRLFAPKAGITPIESTKMNTNTQTMMDCLPVIETSFLASSKLITEPNIAQKLTQNPYGMSS
jgi:hypothetical protein